MTGSLPPFVNACIATLQAVAVVLWLSRGWKPARPTVPSLVMLAASIGPSSAILVLAAHQPSWPILAELAFAVGTWVAVVSLLALGKSFAITPACRAIVRRGPYRLVRHPAYAGELLMVASAAGAIAFGGHHRPLALACAAAGAACLAVGIRWRIKREEQRLSLDDAWVDYARTVRYRLVPGLW